MGPDTESTPLLVNETAKDHELVYQRFSDTQKRSIVAVVSLCGLMPLFVGGTFVPCIPQIAKDLGTTGAAISWAVSTSVFATSIGGLTGSSYSGFYGRRPVYLWLMPVSIMGCIGVACATTMPQLLFWRFLQAFGVAPGISVGAGVIGDIYKLDERGRAMGVFFAAVLLGPALAPFVGGAGAHYASWRALQVMVAGIIFLVFLAILFVLPETSHPGARGIDKGEAQDLPRWRPVLLNPLAGMGMLRSPVLFIVACAGFLTLAVDYVLMVPIAYTIGKRYGIENEALIGACFIPQGIGSMVGAPLAGYYSDKLVANKRSDRGAWYPEDRLRACIPAVLVLIPLSMAGSGLATHYLDGKLGLVVNLVCLFVNGAGIDGALGPMSSYIVDVMHSHSAESMAANSAFRAIILTVFIPGILPMLDKYGVLVTDLLAASFSFLALGLILLSIRYGDTLRAYVDVGFSTEENN